MKKKVYLGFYVVAVLLFLEGAVRLVLSSNALLSKIGLEHEVVRRLYWINSHQNARPLYYAFDVYHPTRGWATKPNVRDMPVFKGKALNTNSQGLRGMAEYAHERAKGRARILVLGDSFTFGDEVSDEETFPAYLRRFLPRSDVLNLGVHGYGHDQMLIYLREEGITYHSDIVIVGFVYLDIYRNIMAFKDFAKPRYALENGRLILRNSPVPSPESVLHSQSYRPRLLDALAILQDELRWRSGESEREAKEVTNAILEELARTIEDSGAIPIFVYLPVQQEITLRRAGPTLGEAFLSNFCVTRGLRCFSVRPALAQKEKEGLRLFSGEHFSAEGHLAVASTIYGYLVRSGLAASGQTEGDDRNGPGGRSGIRRQR